MSPMEASSNDMEEPLLPRTSSSSPPQSPSRNEEDVQPPLSPIPHILEEEFEEEEASREAAPDGYGLQEVFLTLFGRAYGLEADFWVKILPACFIMGALIGLLEIGILWIDHLVFELKAEYASYSGWAVLVGAVAGLLSGTIRACWPDIPRFDKLFQGSLEENSIKSYITLIFNSLIALLTVVPIGPELTIGASAMLLPIVICKALELDSRISSLLVVSALAAAISCLFSSPFVGMVLVYELTVLFQFRARISRSSISLELHSLFESLAMSGATSVTAVLVHKYVLPHCLRAASGRFDLGNDFEAWYWPQSLVLGALGGLIGFVTLMTVGFFERFRLGIGLSKWFDRILFSTAAGAICGAFYIICPQGSMSQVDFLTTVGEAARSGGEAVSAERLLLVAGCKILGLAFSLGFGLVGGHILPVGFIGACIGLAVSSPFIPLSLAVPTFIASSAVSVLPVPFTVVVATASAIVLNPNQIGSVVIAVLVAQAFVNGLGLINKVFDPNGLINDDGSSAIAVDDEQIITFEQDQEDARVEDENAAEVDEEIETSQMEP